ncbi:MAG: HNH endonuclease domain-containing protein, partial [Nanoarchaeota archaeon]
DACSYILQAGILDYIKKCYDMKDFKDKQISYKSIAEAFLKYYWNQVVVYKLKQDFKVQKPAKIVTIIEEKTENINEFYDNFFKKEENIFLKKQLIKSIYNNCLVDVIPRFQRNDKQNIYYHNVKPTPKKPSGIRYYLPKKENRYIILKKEAIKEIGDNYNILFEVLILNWAKFLEKTNFTPKLIEKVERITNPERSSLVKFRNILLNIDEKVCFYCNKNLNKLEKGEIHVDHFIPWSYIFDDNEWNLVLSCSDCNLKKSNHLPSQKDLDRLKYRNEHLPEKLKVQENIIDNYYNSCRKAGFN